jgi:hypothetical protein
MREIGLWSIEIYWFQVDLDIALMKNAIACGMPPLRSIWPRLQHRSTFDSDG